MFYKEKDKNNKYWIWSDKIAGKFGPFEGVYVKNEILGDFGDLLDISSYPGYKYSIGKISSSYFIIDEKSLKQIIKI